MNLQEKAAAYRADKEMTQLDLALKVGTHAPVICNFENTGYAPQRVVDEITKLIDKWEKSK